jgi:cystathionine beta-lyase
MTTYNFDEVINRRGTQSIKYDIFEDDVIPLWVADTDFPAPEPVIRALHERVDHRIFGYPLDPSKLKDVLCQRMADLYDWEVKPGDIIFLPGVVPGFSAAIRAIGQPGDNVLMQTPVYPPFLMAPPANNQTVNNAELTRIEENGRLCYEIDFDAFEAAINDRTKMFLLCSPHNPVGRVWTKAELTRMADICLKHDVVICSDEIHCDLVFEGHRHTPTASISPEIARRAITLMAPSKT